MTITCPVCGKTQDVPKEDEADIGYTMTLPIWTESVKMVCPPCREKIKLT